MKNKENVYIFGWNGFLGINLYKRLIDNKDLSVLRVGKNIESDLNFDLSNPNYNFIDKLCSGDKFIFLAAISSPDYCSTNYEEAYLINVKNTKELIKRLLNKGIDILFASSDVVYGRTLLPVNENSEINPVGRYGEMKADVESEFKDYKNFYIMRLSYISSVRDKFIAYLLLSSKNNTKISVFDPFIRSMIQLDDVINFIIIFIKKTLKIKPIVNLAGPDFISRLQYVDTFAEIFPLKFNKILPPPDFLVERPDTILLESVYLSSYLDKSLKNVLNELKNDLKTINKNKKR